MKYQQLAFPIVLVFASFVAFTKFPDKRSTLSSISIIESHGIFSTIITIEKQIKGNAFDLLSMSGYAETRHDQFIIESDGNSSFMIYGRFSPSSSSTKTRRYNDDYYQYNESSEGDLDIYQVIDGEFRKIRSLSAGELTDEKNPQHSIKQAEVFPEYKILYMYSCMYRVVGLPLQQFSGKHEVTTRFRLSHRLISISQEDFSTVRYAQNDPIKIRIQRDRSIFGETCYVKVLDKKYEIINYKSYRMILAFFLLIMSPLSAIYLYFKSKARSDLAPRASRINV